ncbi:MAG: hypothetical protein ABIO83_11595, partial [Ilumatobacteraceae bacterium]
MRDRRIPATAWTEAPAELLALAGHAARLAGTPDGEAVTSFLRRIGPWLLWRAGPAKGPSICWAGHVDDLSRTHQFVVNADGSASGLGPSGELHLRFRTWKQDLRAHPSLLPTSDRHDAVTLMSDAPLNAGMRTTPS